MLKKGGMKKKKPKKKRLKKMNGLKKTVKKRKFLLSRRLCSLNKVPDINNKAVYAFK